MSGRAIQPSSCHAKCFTRHLQIFACTVSYTWQGEGGPFSPAIPGKTRLSLVRGSSRLVSSEELSPTPRQGPLCRPQRTSSQETNHLQPGSTFPLYPNPTLEGATSVCCINEDRKKSDFRCSAYNFHLGVQTVEFPTTDYLN